MKRIPFLLLLCAAPVLHAERALAQEERDRGFIVGLIEDNLSAPGLSVRLDGFEGALSSRASLDSLVVSDDAGPWLRLEDVVLDWNRSALLRGRLEVEELTAALIEVERLPLPAEGVEPPPAGAPGFSLPELPVSVEIGRVAAERIRVGEPVIGQEVVATLEASATLRDGALDADARATRLEGPEGRFALSASYAPDGALSVDLDLAEAEGGLAATLLNLPGRPAIELSVQGAGPLSDFAADVVLASAGARRLGGAVRLFREGGGQGFDVDLGGDLTELFAPRYRDFFGEDVRIAAEGVLGGGGALSLRALDVDTRALDVAGRAEIGADRWPDVLDLELLLEGEGGPVLLPVGAPVRVARAALSLDYDVATGEAITLDGVVEGLVADAATLDRLALSGRGVIAAEAGGVGAAEGTVALDVTGLALADPALAEAIGDAVALETAVAWRPGEPVALTGLDLSAGDLSLAGDVGIGALAEGFPLTLDLRAASPRLARFAALAGVDLSGAAELSLAGTAAPLAGAFDLALDGAVERLETGIAQADPLLDGRTTLVARARRTEGGTFVEALDLSNPQLSLVGQAAIPAAAEEGEASLPASAQLALDLADLSPLVPQLDGRGTLSVDVSRAAPDAPWRGEAALQAPDGIAASASGVLTGPGADVAIAAVVPDLSPFADLEGGARLSGDVRREGDAYVVDLSGVGPFDSTVTLSGPVTGPDAEVAFTAALPRLGDVAALPEPLAGAARVEGTLTSDEGAYVLAAGLGLDVGITARVAGPVTGRPLDLDVVAEVPDLALLGPVPEGLGGPATLTGRVFDDEGIRVDLRAEGPAGLDAQVAGAVAPLDLDVEAALGDLGALGPVPEGLEGPATLGGRVFQDDGIRLDLRVEGSAGLDAAVRGAVAPLALDVEAALPDLSTLAPVPEALAGAVALEGRVEDRDGAIAARAALSLPQGIAATVDGVVAGGPLDLAVAVEVPEVAALEVIPGPLSGSATLAGTVRSVGAGIAVDLALDGPEGIEARLSGPVTGASLDVEASARVPDVARLAEVPPALSGEAVLDARVRRDARGAILVEADLDGPGIDVTASGPVSGGDVDATFRAAVDDLAALAGLPDALSGPAVLEGRLSGSSEAYALDATLDAPAGIAARVDGQLTGPGADADIFATVPDLALVAPVPGTLSGRLTVEGRLTEAGGAPALDVTLDAPAGITAAVDGVLTGPDADASISVTIPDVSALAPVPEALAGAVSLEGRLTSVDGAPALDATLEGPAGIVATVDGVLTGPDADAAFSVAVPDTGALAALPEALRGRATLEGRLTGTDDGYAVEAGLAAPAGIEAEVSGPVAGPLAFAARLPRVSALAAVPGALDGAVAVEGVADRADDAWAVDATATGPAGLTVRARGPVTGEAARIGIAATLPRLGSVVPAVPDAFAGTYSLDGVVARVGEAYAAEAALTGPQGLRATAETVLTEQPPAVEFTAALPSLAPVAPVPGGLDLSGTAVLADDGVRLTVDGTGPYGASLSVEGTVTGEAPAIEASARVPDASLVAPQLRGPLSLDAAARQVDGTWTFDVDAAGAQGLDASVRGTPEGFDFSVATGNVGAFADVPPALNGPLAASGSARRDAGGRLVVDASGTGPLGARFSVSGPVTGGIEATFDLSVPDIAPLAPDFPGPLRARGTAAQQGDAVALDVTLDGPSGTRAQVGGTVGGAAGLALEVDGTAPLGLANTVLEPQRLSGTAAFDLSVRPGGLSGISGSVTTAGATLVLPTLRNALEGIDARIALAGGRAQVEATASVATGGRIALRGPVGLQAPFDAALQAELDVVLEDPSLYTTRARGTLSVTGPLTGGALIAGRIALAETEISVPSSGVTGLGDLPPITHVGETVPVRRTLERAGLDAEAAAEAASRAAGEGGGPLFRLDVVVSAPSQIFVRGRGLDAELGGELTIRGTTRAPVASGGFDLIRGRLDVLQQRFDLDEGSITFQGSFTPFIRLVARTDADQIDAAIVVEGPANALEVSFESSAGIPEEEIIAQIFFGRDLTELSPLQALQLANSVAVLAGRGSGGLLDSVRGSAGLDDLDITTDSEGNAALRAGKYISDNVYTDVQLGQDGTAKVTLNLDVTDDLTVRGTLGAGGETSLGVFFERDY